MWWLLSVAFVLWIIVTATNHRTHGNVAYRASKTDFVVRFLAELANAAVIVVVIIAGASKQMGSFWLLLVFVLFLAFIFVRLHSAAVDMIMKLRNKSTDTPNHIRYMPRYYWCQWIPLLVVVIGILFR